MARPRKPTKILELRGSFKQNPQRKRLNEPQPEADLGKPPKNLTAAQQKIWYEIIEQTPDGVITRMDRFTLEILTVLLHKVRTTPRVQGAELSTLMRCLTAFGMTPADRSKVVVATKQTKSDGWDDA